MTIISTRGSATLWIGLLTAASLGTTWALACMTPFAALAALAAVHLRRGDGVALMAAAWVASQAVGFGILGYPHDPLTLAWGLALGLAAIGAVLGADLIVARVAAASLPVRLAAAFVAAFVAFKAVLLVADVVLGGSFASTVAPSLLLKQIPREAAVTVALLALYRGLVALGVPAAPRPALAAPRPAHAAA